MKALFHLFMLAVLVHARERPSIADEVVRLTRLYGAGTLSKVQFELLVSQAVLAAQPVGVHHQNDGGAQVAERLLQTAGAPDGRNHPNDGGASQVAERLLQTAGAPDDTEGASMWIKSAEGKIVFGPTASVKLFAANGMLNVGGGLTLGDTGAACTAALQGTLKFDAADKELRLCVDEEWVGVKPPPVPEPTSCVEAKAQSKPSGARRSSAEHLITTKLLLCTTLSLDQAGYALDTRCILIDYIKTQPGCSLSLSAPRSPDRSTPS